MFYMSNKRVDVQYNSKFAVTGKFYFDLGIRQDINITFRQLNIFNLTGSNLQDAQVRV